MENASGLWLLIIPLLMIAGPVLALLFWSWVAQYACLIVEKFKPPYWSSFKASFFIFLLSLLAQFIIGFVIGLLVGITSNQTNPEMTGGINAFMYLASFIINVAISSLIYGKIFKYPSNDEQIGLFSGFLVTLILYLISLMITILISLLIWGSLMLFMLA